MKRKIIFSFLTFLLTACGGNGQPLVSYADIEKRAPVDTMVGSTVITHEIAGAAFRKRAQRYFIVIDKDTSDFSCIFYESKESGKVGIDLKSSSFKKGIPYRKRLEELRVILPRAARDFNFDSLESVSLGRLVSTGDLAIAVTNQYRRQFGYRHKIEPYRTVAGFMKESAIGTDLNRLFKPYFLTVDHVSIEKLFFATQKELYGASRIETDSAYVPEKILDCITWVTMKKQQKTPRSSPY